jgi:bacteriorhodopsin
MAPLVDGWDYGSWSAVYNALSFGIAGMGSATIFFWLQVPNVTKTYRTALTITGLVTAIATYHYFRIFNSWNDAFEVKYSADAGDYVVKLSGAPFNDAYRYVDWVLTVPLLLIELILVMGLPAKETVSKSWTLGLASAIMVALGYPGEIQSDPAARWKFWFLAMIPFLYVVAELAVGLQNAAGKQTEAVASLTAYARWLTIISWCTYPFVYIIKMLGISGVSATAGEQIGYSIADVVAKAVFGILIWAIAAEKSKIEEKVMAGELVASEAKASSLREQLETPLLA